MSSDNNKSSGHPLTPAIPFTAKDDFYKRNTRPTGQRDMRPKAVALRRADPRSLNIGRKRVDISESLVDEIIKNVGNGAGMNPAVVATGRAHPRMVHKWVALGQTECEWRQWGQPCEDCSTVAGLPEGCEKCKFTGLIPHEPDPSKDLHVKLFSGLNQAKAQYNNSVEKTLIINATETQIITKKTYGVDEKGNEILKGITVTEVLADWRAADVIRNRIRKGQQLAAFNRGVSPEEFDRNRIAPQYDEVGILQFSTLFGIERSQDQGNAHEPLDINPYMSRLSDDVKVQLALEVGQLIAEDEASRKTMKEERVDGDMLIIEGDKD